jgi:hypothetical protein
MAADWRVVAAIALVGGRVGSSRSISRLWSSVEAEPVVESDRIAGDIRRARWDGGYRAKP